MSQSARLDASTKWSSVIRRKQVVLDTTRHVCLVDGIEHAAHIGHWMFYLPDTGEKFFHAAHGTTDCTHSTRPTATQLQQDWANDTYTSADWRRALATPLARRLAELWIAGQRLWRAGLGPRPLGITCAAQFVRDGIPLGETMGLRSDNAEHLPPKSEATVDDLIAAGVQPDRILSCVRQQLNGYVIDLTSVVGVTPMDAEHEVQQAFQWIERARLAAPAV